MARVFAHHLRRDMAVLGLCELSLSAVFLGLLSISVHEWVGFTGVSWPAMRSAMGLAGTIAVSIAATAATMGLYRPQICRDPGRMLKTTTITGILASPLILWVSGSSLSGLTVAQMGWVAQVLGVWLTAVLVSRVSFGLLSANGRFTRHILIVADGDGGARSGGVSAGWGAAFVGPHEACARCRGQYRVADRDAAGDGRDRARDQTG